ncbi:unnamed protein product [Arctia plantaginis]|uniref:Peptidase aspartic putative domain-containing protein n=1 Tax=Arctia plantaginis TaxID=874455 RepID=A0A8S1A7H9_ARCPL|nr:unnamed protein product [Arctia plantaginis]
MTELKELIKQRATIRSRITLFERFLTPLKCLDSVTERNKLINNELSLRLTKFQELSYTFDEVQSKIEGLDSDLSKQMEEREQTENQFFQLIVTAQEFLEAYNDSKLKQGDESSCRGSSASITNHVKLPPLKIPPYSGDTKRNAKVYQWKICSNCLRNDHLSYQCRLAGCRVCKRRHNTLLHRSNNLPSGSQPRQSQSSSSPRHEIQNNVEPSTNNLPNSLEATINSKNGSASPNPIVTVSAGSSNLALLATAVVEVSNNGNIFKLRALLGNGSQYSFITEAARAKLACVTTKESQYVSGLQNATVGIAEHCNIKVQSTYSSYSCDVTCYVLPVITDVLPQAEIRVNELDIPSNLQLADPAFFRPGDIDLLLGAEIFWDVLGSSQVKLGRDKPVLRETLLGWIVAGRNWVNYYKRPNKVYCNFSKTIQEQLVKFWELEEIPNSKPTSNSDDYCETLYNETTQREGDDVNTARGLIRRAITNLCPLPNERDEDPRSPKVFEGGKMSTLTIT